MAKIQITSEDGNFWNQLIDWLNEFPNDELKPTTITMMNSPGDITAQQIMDSCSDIIDEVEDDFNVSF